MLAKRIIACLDVLDGKVVKGRSFRKLQYAGEPVELASRYEREGADELVFLDISATLESRSTMVSIVKKVASNVNIPLTVGGGIRNLDDIKKLLRAGADKVSINSAAIENPALITKAAEKFGSQCIAVAIDAKRSDGDWAVYSRSGTRKANMSALGWAKEVERRGAGEILLTSIDSDGGKSGYDFELVRKIATSVSIPVIASGGAGKMRDFYRVFREGAADAALAASVFHYNDFSIADLKEYLSKMGIHVRKSENG